VSALKYLAGKFEIKDGRSHVGGKSPPRLGDSAPYLKQNFGGGQMEKYSRGRMCKKGVGFGSYPSPATPKLHPSRLRLARGRRRRGKKWTKRWDDIDARGGKRANFSRKIDATKTCTKKRGGEGVF